MLNTIRESTQGWIATFIIVLIAIPFALWGVNSYFEGGSKVSVAKVGSDEISAEMYQKALDQQRRIMQQYFGQRPLDPAIFENPAFKRRVVEGLVDRVLVNRAAQEQGYRISNADLAQIITQEPRFQRDGHFDQGLYEVLLRDAGLSVKEFEDRIRHEGLAKQVESGYAESAIATQADVENLLRLEGQKRYLSYAVLKPDKYLDKVQITEEALGNYYTTHTDRYRTPERVRIEYIRLSQDTIQRQVKISEEELRKTYADEESQYTAAEQRRASHILIKLPEANGTESDKQALSQAQALRKALLAGANFSDAAKKNSADPGSAAKGGDLGFVARGTFAKEFDDALFALKRGQLSEPVKTIYGYHLIKLTEIKTAKRKSFNEVRAELETTLRVRKAEQQFYELSEQFRNLVYEQSDSLAPAAKALGLEIQKTEWFSREQPIDIASSPEVIQAVFDPDVLEQGHNSRALEIGTNVLLALRVTAHEPEQLKPMAAVRTELERELRHKLALEESVRAGTALLEQLKTQGNWTSSLKQHDLTPIAPKPITRREPQNLPGKLVEAVFQAVRPSTDKPVFGGTLLEAEGYAVFVLQQVEEIDPKLADNAERSRIRDLLTERHGASYFRNYVDGLRQGASINIYTGNL